MKLIVGLGNPGREYELTRHNVGFMLLDKLFEQMKNENSKVQNFRIENKFKAEIAILDDWVLLKPMTFMNKSGLAVQKVMQFYKIALHDVFVIHDDLDIALGNYKISDRGPKVHNGINSIRGAVGEDFWYVRIGVDGRSQTEISPLTGKDYVLQAFSKEEKKLLDEMMPQVIDSLTKKAGEV